MAAPILTTEPAIKKLSGATPQVDGITMTAPNDAQDVPVGAIQPSNKTPNVASSIRHDDKLRLDAPIEQSTMSAQTIAPTPAIERLNQVHGVAITVPNNAGDLPVRAIHPNNKTPSVESSTWNDRLVRGAQATKAYRVCCLVRLMGIMLQNEHCKP